MAQSFTSYSLENDQAFKAALERGKEVVKDFRIPFGLISSDFYKSEQAIFKLKGPGQYPPFKNQRADLGGMSPYQKQKLKKYGFDYPLLVRTGRLSNSLLGPRNAGSINLITPLSLVIGTSVPYGIYHQSDEPRKKIPLRKFIFIGPEAPKFATSEQAGRLKRWLGIIDDHVSKKLKQAGL